MVCDKPQKKKNTPLYLPLKVSPILQLLSATILKSGFPVVFSSKLWKSGARKRELQQVELLKCNKNILLKIYNNMIKLYIFLISIKYKMEKMPKIDKV